MCSPSRPHLITLVRPVLPQDWTDWTIEKLARETEGGRPGEVRAGAGDGDEGNFNFSG